MRKSKDPYPVRVDFERQFVTPPKSYILQLYRPRQEPQLASQLGASGIDVSGFTLHIETWRASTGTPHRFAGSLTSTFLVRPSTRWTFKLALLPSRGITFDSPSVYVALNFLDADCKANLRIKFSMPMSIEHRTFSAASWCGWALISCSITCLIIQDLGISPNVPEVRESDLPVYREILSHYVRKRDRVRLLHSHIDCLGSSRDPSEFWVRRCTFPVRLPRKV